MQKWKDSEAKLQQTLSKSEHLEKMLSLESQKCAKAEAEFSRCQFELEQSSRLVADLQMQLEQH